MFKEVNYEDAVNNRIFDDNVSKRIAVVIPVYNEADKLPAMFDSVVKQTVPEGHILDVFVGLDKSMDKSESIIRSYGDKLNIYLHKSVNNTDRKVGNLNQVYRLFFGDMQQEKPSKMHMQAVANIDAFVGMDADVMLGHDCILKLYSELRQQFRIGAVSANFVALIPANKNKLSKNDPNYEYLIQHGKFGGWFSRFLTVQQNKSFVSDTLEQKHNNFVSNILGGQCSIFRPDALKNIYDTYRLNGIYSNETPTEDLLLTQQLKKLNWTCLISESARTYVDAMTDMSSYVNQITKWKSGKLDYMTKAGISTPYARRSWVDEISLFMNVLIRVMMLILIPISLALDEFDFSWIWLLPLIIGIVLNLYTVYKTPFHRFVDYLSSLFMVSGEFEIWFNAAVDAKAWHELSKTQKDDLWARQYQAENGSLVSHHLGLMATIVLIALAALGIKLDILSSQSAVDTIKPYVTQGFSLLTLMTIITTFLMLRKMLKIRGGFKA